jgi:hypothetical protein
MKRENAFSGQNTLTTEDWDALCSFFKLLIQADKENLIQNENIRDQHNPDKT